MKLEQSFEVAAPLERVWEALIDVERVAPCLPGASVTGKNDDGTYTGEFKVKIGPTSAAYSGKLNMEDIDAEKHTATMQASGTDRRGQGGAKATIVSSVAEAGEGQARVDVSTDYHITGRLARFGRGGMIEEISNRLLGEFAKNLQTMLAGGGDEAAPADAPVATEAVAVEDPDAVIGGATPIAEEPSSPPSEEPAPAVEEPAPAAEEPARAAEEPAPAAEEPAPAAEEPARAAEEPTAPEEPAPADIRTEDSPPPTSSAPEVEPISAVSLVGSVALRRAKENPAPLAALVIGFLVALRVLRRRS